MKQVAISESKTHCLAALLELDKARKAIHITRFDKPIEESNWQGCD
jgi:hypothetical protein